MARIASSILTRFARHSVSDPNSCTYVSQSCVDPQLARLEAIAKIIWKSMHVGESMLVHAELLAADALFVSMLLTFVFGMNSTQLN